MNVQKLTFPNEEGITLSARLNLPEDGRPRAYALFAHCFTCSKDLRAVNHISRALAARGIGILRFDFTGLGESSGDFADTNFSSNVADLVAAADFMDETLAAPQLLVGHSLGGAAVLQAACQIEAVRAVATIGAPAEPGHVAHLLQSSQEEIEEQGEARVVLAGRPFTIKKQFLDDINGGAVIRDIGRLKRALLIFHSPFDDTVGIDDAATIFKQARHPKSFISLDNADHLLTDEADARYVGAVLAVWVARYLEL